MYAQVTSLQYYPDKLEEGVQVANEMVVPAVKQQQGFKSFIALKDATTGKAMLITLFETEADAKLESAAVVLSPNSQQKSHHIFPSHRQLQSLRLLSRVKLSPVRTGGEKNFSPPTEPQLRFRFLVLHLLF